jgi:hypothetical protein
MSRLNRAYDIHYKVHAERDKRACTLYQAKMAAARDFGITVGTVNRNMRRVRQAEATPETDVTIKPTYSIRKDTRPKGKAKRVTVIGDLHDKPDLGNDRFYWLGRHVANRRPDCLVQIGDWLTFDSLCKYDPNWTWGGQEQPTLQQDLQSADKSFEAFEEGLGDDSFLEEKHITLGNHEYRLEKFANETPEVYGLLQQMLYDMLRDYGWTYSPYGEIWFVDGVGFVHVPLNEKGSEYGGKTAEKRIASDTTFDVVMGHSHKAREHTEPKIGGDFVRVLNVGCAMPDGYIPGYAMRSATGWTYGVYDLTIRDGHIDSWDHTSMKELEERYGSY